MKTEIASFTNASELTTSVIVEFESKYHVSLRDDESGEYLPFVKIFPIANDAIAYAKKIANIN